jgi:TonB family protein
MRQQIFCLALIGLVGCVKPASANQNLNTVLDTNDPASVFTQVKIQYQPPPPVYPEEAKALGIQGVVIVEMVIGPDGIPTQATAYSGPKELRASSEAYAFQWKFFPALLNGKPQYARFVLRLPYNLP